MNKYIFTVLAKTITFYFMFFALPGVSIAQVAEKIGPNNMGRWLVGDFEIYFDIKCDISRSKLWPEKYCSEPYVVVSKGVEKGQNSLSSTTQYFKLVAADIELGDKWMFDGNEDPHRQVSVADITFGSVRSAELFRLLMSKENLKITFLTRVGQGAPVKSRFIVLTGFKSYADKEIEAINSRYDQEVSDARRNLMTALVVAASFLVMAFWCVRFLLRKTRAKIVAVTEHIETRRISRVAEDEAIRVVVRESVQEASDQSLETLRNQIKVALDAGDTKTAQELLRIMSCLEAK